MEPPMTSGSSLQSNWKASPGANVRGTNAPRPVVWVASYWSCRHFLANAATRSYEPSNPKATKSLKSWRILRRCLRPFLASLLSHPSNLGAKASSLLATLRAGYLGSTTPLLRYLRTVLRDKPDLRDISRILIPSLRCHRLITLNNATLITPVSPAQY